jgi:ubiquinone/menaquinone biosynthesis C-methylase UbiE
MAALYDPVLHIAERRWLGRWRAEVLAHIHGRVLELGAGTGLNLQHYSAAVTELVLTEPDAHMRHVLERRLARAPRQVTISDADAQALPFADASFDAVVSTLVLCSIPDVPRALAEVRRVLKPGGVLAFLEHVGGAKGSRRLRWQRRLEPAWGRVAGGCQLTRRTVESLGAAGFSMRWLESDDLPGVLALGAPVVRGVAGP